MSRHPASSSPIGEDVRPPGLSRTMNVDRRVLLAGGLASALAAIGARSAASATDASAASVDGGTSARPNILFVLADDLGWGELGSFGQSTIRTPVLDGLAAEGMRFTDAYANPTCAPSRFSMLTGFHTGHARVTENAQAKVGFVDSDLTVGAILQEAGYRTGCVGKWGFGPDTGDNVSHPNRQGFDHFMGYLTHLHAHDYWPTYLWRNGTKVEYPENANSNSTYAGTVLAEECLTFLDETPEDQPFFLYASLTTPHAPNDHPSDAPYSDQPWPEGERNHAAQITWLDTQVGRLLDRLRDQGRLENTLVIFTSDNGPHNEGRYIWVGSTTTHDEEFFDSNGPLRGLKRDVYEGGIRVPMVAWVPPSLRTSETPEPGSVIETPMALWDLLPTCADVAGVPTPPGLDGHSWLPTLTRGADIDRPYIYVNNPEQGFRESVRFGHWKAVRPPQQTSLELYNLATDLGEQHDVAAGHPAVVRRAETLIAAAKA